MLSAPVVFAVMAVELFNATWVPSLMMSYWFQLALIAPVMFYAGWPIHRTGWLALSHRTTEMNSLITLGTIAAFAAFATAWWSPSPPVCCLPIPDTCATKPSGSSSP